ncbi:MAG: acyl-CoA dehydrogenase family protein [Gemmatimonadaceae bacterium]
MSSLIEGARAPLTALTEDERLFRDAVATFADEEVRPRVATMERQSALDPALIAKTFEMGLMGIEVPEAYGGADGTMMMVTLAVEEISKVDASAAILVDVQNTLALYPLRTYGTDQQKQRYLPNLTTSTVAAYALSEPAAGSDAFGLETRAEMRNGRWVLNGRKLWITNGGEADVFVLFANADPSAGYRGITAFIVERGFPGFRVGKKEDKLGIRASSTAELILDDCEVPVENVLGATGQGYKIAIDTLNGGRIGIGAQMVGIASGAGGDDGIREGAEAIREGDCRKSGGPVPIGAGGHRTRSSTSDGLQCLANARCWGGHRKGRSDGQASLVAGVRACDVAVRRTLWRVRVYEGLPRREVLSRCQDRNDLRRHLEHAAPHHRQGDPALGGCGAVAAGLSRSGPRANLRSGGAAA